MNTLRAVLLPSMLFAGLAGFSPLAMSDEQTGMSEQAVQAYLAAWSRHDVDAMLHTLSDDAVVMLPHQKPIKGKNNIRALFRAFVDEFSQTGAVFAYEDLKAAGPVVSFLWKGDTPSNVYPFGSNTFVVENGKIAYETVTLLSEPKPAGVAAREMHKTVAAANVRWSPAPPNLPRGAELAILTGDPGKPGLFIMRARFPDGTTIAPHWHSQTENVTVLEGTFRFGMGKRFDESVTTPVTAGGFLLAPARMPHFGRTDGRTVMEISGMGPFDLNYVNPEDDPSRQAAE